MATTLLNSAATGRFDARWSDLILHDAEEHAIRTDTSGRPDGARRRFALLRGEAFADNLVPDREVDDALRYVSQGMPDPEDRHVVATAIAAGARIITTANLNDFPTEAMARAGTSEQRRAGGIEVIAADPVLCDVWAGDETGAAELLAGQAAELLRTRPTWPAFVDRVRSQLPGFAQLAAEGAPSSAHMDNMIQTIRTPLLTARLAGDVAPTLTLTGADPGRHAPDPADVGCLEPRRPVPYLEATTATAAPDRRRPRCLTSPADKCVK